MKLAVLGGGPAGLFFAALMKQRDPRHEIVVYERNRLADTFGFGVVFSDATEEALAHADADVVSQMARDSHRWDDIEIHYGGKTLVSGGHGFSGLSRRTLLSILASRCEALGVKLCLEHTIADPETLRGADLVLGADGVNSIVRERYKDRFEPLIDTRPNRFVWLGTTRPFPAFTFDFVRDAHGLWRLHAYQYEPGASTFIVEAREETWRAAGMDQADEAQTIAFCEKLFAERLAGHKLVSNRSIWRAFPTIRNRRWSFENVVLIGDAAHTAHFSVGSGTKLAMEDAIALAQALGEQRDVKAALAAYESARRPPVESLQRAAQASLQWFEDTERYMTLEPIQFAFTLLTRSLRVTHENLKVRDPKFVGAVDEWYVREAEKQSGAKATRGPKGEAPPPMFTPLKLRELVLENRVAVSPMCQYSAEDGTPNDWHLVHLGSRAMGGAGLVYAEMTNVSRDARISPGCTGLYKPEHVAAWRRITDFIHRETRAKVAIQLGHAGRKGSTKKLWEGDSIPLEDGNWPLLSAWALPYDEGNQTPRAMTRADMDVAVADYAASAERAEAAGFDLLEVHMAHGYLLATFISPLTNQRDDEYGGSLDNRMRFPLEVFDAVRAVWPAHKPLSARISAVDWMPGGIESEHAVEISHLLKAHGCDVVDVSVGQTVPDQKPVYGRLFQTPFAERIRHEVGIATMAVGNISSYTDVNTILAAGRADLCLLARAHLWDPYWTRHAAYELGWPLKWPDPYESLDRYKPRFI